MSASVSKPLLFLVILSIIGLSAQDVINNEVDSDNKDESPLADVAKEILKEKNLENIGGMVSSFIQSGGAKQILDGVLQNLASSEQSGQLLESLGNVLGSANQDTAQPSKKSKKSKKGSKKSGGEVNPLSLLSGLGSLVGALQGAGNANGNGNPADLLQGLGSLLGGGGNKEGEGNNAAALLQGLGSLLSNADDQKESKSDDNGGAALLQGLGSILGAAAGNQEGGASLLQGLGSLVGAANNQEDGGNNAGALLQGLGAVLSGGQGGEGGINPEMIGNVINMFADAASDNSNENNEVPSKANSKKASSEPQKAKKVKKTNKDDAFDFASLLNIASTFLNQDSGKGKTTEGSSLLNYLPMILNTINAFTGSEAQERASSHSDHSWSLPPILERIHVLYDNFLHSEIGKQILAYVSTDNAFKPFRDENGNFSYQKFEELIENHSFRKHWIQQLAGKLVDLLKMISDENMQNNYIINGIHFANSLLKNYGFPKRTWFDTKKPVESITNFANYVAKKYLDYNFDTREYVAPIVLYVQDVLKLAKETLPLGVEPKELTDKLTNTINLELIEPITRVNRAYRFAKSQPKCDRYVLCLINQHPSNDYESFPNLKKSLYKGSSLIAGWFVSSHTGTSYWDLYEVITQSKSCKKYHSDQCNGFHDEDIKVTTEYVHNEL